MWLHPTVQGVGLVSLSQSTSVVSPQTSIISLKSFRMPSFVWSVGLQAEGWDFRIQEARKTTRLPCRRFRLEGGGRKVEGSRFWFSGFGFRVPGFGFRVSGAGNAPAGPSARRRPQAPRPSAAAAAAKGL